MVSNLYEMNQRRQQWMDEKPSWDGNTQELRGLGEGDTVIFNFVSNGDDRDRFIKIYRAHIVDKKIQPKDGRPAFNISETRYCPQQSGDTETPCPLCQAGHTVVKERMSIWMYVQNIMHAQLPSKMPEGKTFPYVQFNSRNMFNEEVNDFKIWHASAWRESPWGDIIRMFELFKGLHNFTAQMDVVGQKLSRRYKIYGVPNSPFLAESVWAAAQEQCMPITDILRAEVNEPIQTQENPQPMQTQQTSLGTPTPFIAPGQAAPVFQFPSAAEVSPPVVTDVTEAVVQNPQGATPEPPAVEPTPQAESNPGRPMKSLF